MGLKDMLARIGGKKADPPRGSRGARQQRRTRDDGTREMEAPAGWQVQNEPPRPPSRPRTEPIPTPAYQPPPEDRRAPAAPTPTPAAAPPAPAPVSAQATIIGPSPFHMDLVGVLVGIHGELRGKMFAVQDGENDLGRSAECSIRLNDLQVSRKAQAQIVHQDGIFVLRAMQKDRPVFLNDEPVAEADALSDGDKLKLGATVFRFRTIEA